MRCWILISWLLVVWVACINSTLVTTLKYSDIVKGTSRHTLSCRVLNLIATETSFSDAVAMKRMSRMTFDCILSEFQFQMYTSIRGILVKLYFKHLDQDTDIIRSYINTPPFIYYDEADEYTLMESMIKLRWRQQFHHRLQWLMNEKKWNPLLLMELVAKYDPPVYHYYLDLGYFQPTQRHLNALLSSPSKGRGTVSRILQLDTSYQPTWQTLSFAVMGGHLDVFLHLFQRMISFHGDHWKAGSLVMHSRLFYVELRKLGWKCAQYGRLSIMKYLISTYPMFTVDQEMVALAILHNRTSVAEYLLFELGQRSYISTPSLCSWAVNSASADMVHLVLCQDYYKEDPATMQLAFQDSVYNPFRQVSVDLFRVLFQGSVVPFPFMELSFYTGNDRLFQYFIKKRNFIPKASLIRFAHACATSSSRIHCFPPSIFQVYFLSHSYPLDDFLTRMSLRVLQVSRFVVMHFGLHSFPSSSLHSTTPPSLTRVIAKTRTFRTLGKSTVSPKPVIPSTHSSVLRVPLVPSKSHSLQQLPLGVLYQYVLKQLPLKEASSLAMTNSYFRHVEVLPFAKFISLEHLVHSLYSGLLSPAITHRIKYFLNKPPFLCWSWVKDKRFRETDLLNFMLRSGWKQEFLERVQLQHTCLNLPENQLHDIILGTAIQYDQTLYDQVQRFFNSTVSCYTVLSALHSQHAHVRQLAIKWMNQVPDCPVVHHFRERLHHFSPDVVILILERYRRDLGRDVQSIVHQVIRFALTEGLYDIFNATTRAFPMFVPEYTDQDVWAAVASGETRLLDALDRLPTGDLATPIYLCTTAIRSGSLMMVYRLCNETLYDQYAFRIEDALSRSLQDPHKYPQMNLVLYFIEQQHLFDPSENTLGNAIRVGDIPLIQYLVTTRKIQPSLNFILIAKQCISGGVCPMFTQQPLTKDVAIKGKIHVENTKRYNGLVYLLSILN